jgi:hypothetical protein
MGGRVGIRAQGSPIKPGSRTACPSHHALNASSARALSPQSLGCSQAVSDCKSGEGTAGRPTPKTKRSSRLRTPNPGSVRWHADGLRTQCPRRWGSQRRGVMPAWPRGSESSVEPVLVCAASSDCAARTRGRHRHLTGESTTLNGSHLSLQPQLSKDSYQEHHVMAKPAPKVRMGQHGLTG